MGGVWGQFDGLEVGLDNKCEINDVHFVIRKKESSREKSNIIM